MLSTLAIVAAVMTISATLVYTDMMIRMIDVHYRVLEGAVDVEITASASADQSSLTSQSRPVPAKLLAELATLPGVKRADGYVAADGARVVGPTGKTLLSQGAPRLGIAYPADTSLVELSRGRAPRTPDEVAINANLAARGRFDVGSHIDILTLQPRRTFSVVGVFRYRDGRDSVGGQTVVAFIRSTAQQLMLGQPDVYSGIGIMAEPGVSAVQLRDAIRRQLGMDYEVHSGMELADAQANTSEQFVRIVRNTLLGFAGIVLFMAVFLIANTFSILIAQRMRQLALFRALGASRLQVLGSVLLEASIVGAIASTIGVVAGIGLAVLLWPALELSRNEPLSAPPLEVPFNAIVIGFLVGFFATTIASVVPAMRASFIPPVAAIRDAGRPDKSLRVLTALGVIAGLLGACFVVIAAFVDPVQSGFWALVTGIVLVLAGQALLLPALSRPVLTILGATLGWSTTGKLAQRNSTRNPRRTAATVATMAIGLTVIASVSIIGNSITASLVQMMTQDLRAQLVIAGDSGGPFVPTYDASVIQEARKIPGVIRAAALYTNFGQLRSSAAPVEAADLPAIAEMFSLKKKAGLFRDLQPGEVAVDDHFASLHHVSVGGILQFGTSGAEPQMFRVLAIYQATVFLPGPVFSIQDGVAGLTYPQPTQGYVALRPSSDLMVTRRQLEALLADNAEVSVTTPLESIRQQMVQIGTTQFVIYGALALALVIAMLGIGNTMALSIVERTRELGLLRTLGMHRAQLARMVVAESVMTSLFAAAVGVPIGYALAAAVVFTVRDRGIRVFDFSAPTIGVLLGLSLIAGLVAAVLPAARLARTEMLRAVQYE